MNKSYIKPNIVMKEMASANMIALSLTMSDEAASSSYEGGGDSKLRIVDVLGSEQSSDDSEDW